MSFKVKATFSHLEAPLVLEKVTRDKQQVDIRESTSVGEIRRAIAQHEKINVNPRALSLQDSTGNALTDDNAAIPAPITGATEVDCSLNVLDYQLSFDSIPTLNPNKGKVLRCGKCLTKELDPVKWSESGWTQHRSGVVCCKGCTEKVNRVLNLQPDHPVAVCPFNLTPTDPFSKAYDGTPFPNLVTEPTTSILCKLEEFLRCAKRLPDGSVCSSRAFVREEAHPPLCEQHFHEHEQDAEKAGVVVEAKQNVSQVDMLSMCRKNPKSCYRALKYCTNCHTACCVSCEKDPHKGHELKPLGFAAPVTRFMNASRFAVLSDALQRNERENRNDQQNYDFLCRHKEEMHRQVSENEKLVCAALKKEEEFALQQVEKIRRSIIDGTASNLESVQRQAAVCRSMIDDQVGEDVQALLSRFENQRHPLQGELIGRQGLLRSLMTAAPELTLVNQQPSMDYASRYESSNHVDECRTSVHTLHTTLPPKLIYFTAPKPPVGPNNAENAAVLKFAEMNVTVASFGTESLKLEKAIHYCSPQLTVQYSQWPSEAPTSQQMASMMQYVLYGRLPAFNEADDKLIQAAAERDTPRAIFDFLVGSEFSSGARFSPNSQLQWSAFQKRCEELTGTTPQAAAEQRTNDTYFEALPRELKGALVN